MKNLYSTYKNKKKSDSDKLKYANGIVRIPTKKLKELKIKYKDYFLYERKPIDGNIYHGNLLLDYDGITSKVVKQMVMSELASSVDLMYTYNEEKLSWEVL